MHSRTPFPRSRRHFTAITGPRLREDLPGLDLLVDDSPDAILMAENGAVVYANHACVALFGLQAQSAFVGVQVDALVAVRDRDLARARRRKLAPEGKRSDDSTVRMCRPDGSEFDVFMRSRAVRHRGHLFIQMILRDLSEALATARASSLAEKRYRTLFELSPTGLVELRGLTIIEANDRSAWILGFANAGAVIGHELHEFIAEPDRGMLFRGLDHAVNSPAPPHSFEVRTMAGANGVTHVNFKPAHLEGGDARHLVLAVRDASELRLLKSRLQSEQTYFRNLADQAPVMLWTADLLGNFTWLNAAWSRFSAAFDGMCDANRQADDSVATNRMFETWLAAMHPDDRDGSLAIYRDAVTRLASFDIEYRLRDHCGEYHWMVCRGRLHRGTRGAPDGFIGCNLDIEAIKRLETALIAANTGLEEQLERRTADLRAFNYSVSHDLRSPVRAINGFVEFLREDLAAGDLESASSLAVRVGAAGRHLESMLEKLLQYAMRAETALSTEMVSQNDLLRRVISSLEAHDAEIIVHELPPAICDRLLVEEVWNNLIGNAVKYSAKVARPRIEIGFADGAYFVRDNGVGFDMADYRRLFGLFNRLHPEHQFKGTGAGLAITRRIIVDHGGEIWADSSPGEGACFHFTLPMD